MFGIIKKETFDFCMKPVSYEVLNTQLTRCRCYILALGPNANKSNITSQALQDAIPSLYNVPIVAHLMKKEDGSGWYVGGHDSKIVITDESIYFEDQTVPFGLVPESCNPELVTVLEPDGITSNTYLVADIILWTGRYNILDAKYSDDTYFHQSCEIEIIQGEYENEKDSFRIDKFTFSALCLLGKSDNERYDTRPCFPSCKVERKSTYSSESEKFKSEYALLKQEISKYDNQANKKFKESANNMIEKLITKLAQYKYKNQYGEDAYRYAYIDHNKEIVSVLDREQNNSICAFEYKVIDDTIEIDFESRMERSLTTRDKVDVDGLFSIDAEIQHNISTALNFAEDTAVSNITSQLDDVMAKYNKAKEDIKNLKSKLDVFEHEKHEAEERAVRIEREKIFDKYNLTLANNPEYLVFKTTADKYAPEEIERECLLIAGRQLISRTNKYSLNTPAYNPVVTSVENESSTFDSDDSRYGDLLEKVK